MSNENIKNKVVGGLAWQFLQGLICQIVSFSVSVVLARLLMPSDYGVVAIAGMFLILTGIFINRGMGSALIQKKDADDLDFNTVFYIGLFLSLVLYFLVFILAPFISSLFSTPLLEPVLKVLALGMPIGALSGVQNAFVKKEMQFKKLFVSNMFGTISSAIIGLWMAYSGFGVWALVAQSLTTTILNTLMLFLIIDWHPKLVFSYSRFKSLFSFGWRMTVVEVLITFFYQLKGYVIGYKYTAANLAFYNRGEGLPGILFNNINGSITSVLFPALAKLQDDKLALKNALRRSMRISSFVLMPALFGLAAMSDKVIPLLYSEKWSPAIPFMQVICFISCSDILGMANYQALEATGRAKTLLKLEFIKRPLMFAILIATMFISPIAIAIGQLAYSICAFIINAFPNRKYIGYPIVEQLRDVGTSFLLALCMATIVYFIGFISVNLFLCVVLQILIGIVLYVALAKYFNKEDFDYVWSIVNTKIKKS